MYGVLIALIPAFLVSLYYFGLGALIVTIVSVASCLIAEYLIQKFLLQKTPTLWDGSAILTGILLAFNLPSNLPVWIIIIGALVAIGIGKMSFGGLGSTHYLDAETGATVLSAMQWDASAIPAVKDMLLGNMGGSLGEIGAIALLIGFVFMLWRKIITWHIPVAIIGTVFIFTGIMHGINPTIYVNPLIHLLSGGLLLGAIFMATDYVTSPMSKAGMIVYGIGIGIITTVIRLFGSYPEGMSFAILIMNAFTPLINSYIQPKHFGGK
jgi:electron transport complex protein RnfD